MLTTTNITDVFNSIPIIVNNNESHKDYKDHDALAAKYDNFTGAGVIIVYRNERMGDYLILGENTKKKNLCDFGGKIEKGETVKEAAVREVEEECNITISKRGDKICKTYHVYVYKDEIVLKKTHWYKMKAKGQQKLKPQKEEGITDVRWFKPNDIDAILANTFPSILDVLAEMKLIIDKPVLLSE